MGVTPLTVARRMARLMAGLGHVQATPAAQGCADWPARARRPAWIPGEPAGVEAGGCWELSGVTASRREHPAGSQETVSPHRPLLQPLSLLSSSLSLEGSCASTPVRCPRHRGAQAGCHAGWGPAGCGAGSPLPVRGVCVSRQASRC